MDGSTLADKYLEKGWLVIGLARWSPTASYPNLENAFKNKNFIWETGDICEKEFMYEMFKKYEPDIVYNMAAISLVPESFKIPIRVFNVNTIALLNMLELIRHYFPKIKILQASSSEQIGSNTESPQNTESRMLPTSIYATSKLASYHLIRIYRQAYGIFAVNCMAWNHEGNRRGPNFVTRKITRHVAKIFHGSKIPLKLGNIDAYRDWGLSSDYCVPGNTKILAKADEKAYHTIFSRDIKDLKIGNEVLTYNIKNGNKEFKKILKTQDRIVNEIFEIVLDNGNKLEITGNHPVAIIEKGNVIWKKVEDLEKHDKMIQKNHFSVTRRIRNFSENKTRMTNDVKLKISKPHKGKKLTEKTKKKIRLSTNIRYKDVQERMKSSRPGNLNSNYISGKTLVIGKCQHCNKDLGKLSYYNDIKLCKSCSTREKWKDEEYAKNVISKTLQSNKKSPNKPEQHLSHIINDNFPNTFKFVGNGKKMIGKFCPDFVYENKKKIIELYGSYWHNKPEIIQRDIRRKNKYEDSGYELLVIYDTELTNEHNIVSKIENFLFNPDVEILTIKKIKKTTKKTKVYNIETQDNHNYFAYGMLIHNCDAMTLMMEADKPDDYAVNTGEAHSVREFVEKSFHEIGRTLIWKGEGINERAHDQNGQLVVEINEKYYRPTEVPYLHGDHNKIKEKLGWTPTTTFEELVKIMMKHDLNIE